MGAKRSRVQERFTPISIFPRQGGRGYAEVCLRGNDGGSARERRLCGAGRRANGQHRVRGLEDEEDGDDGEGECAEVADGGCEALGYGQLEVGGEGGDAMGGVEEGRGEQDDEEQLGDGVAEEGEDVVVGDGVGQPSEGAGDVVGEDEGGQYEAATVPPTLKSAHHIGSSFCIVVLPVISLGRRE